MNQVHRPLLSSHQAGIHSATSTPNFSSYATIHGNKTDLSPTGKNHHLQSLTFAPVARHFVVEHGEPVCHPEYENATTIHQFVHINGFEDPLGNVHATRRLKTIIANGVFLGKHPGQILFGLALNGHFERLLDFFVQGEGRGLRVIFGVQGGLGFNTADQVF